MATTRKARREEAEEESKEERTSRVKVWGDNGGTRKNRIIHIKTSKHISKQTLEVGGRGFGAGTHSSS